MATIVGNKMVWGNVNVSGVSAPEGNGKEGAVAQGEATKGRQA